MKKKKLLKKGGGIVGKRKLFGVSGRCGGRLPLERPGGGEGDWKKKDELSRMVWVGSLRKNPDERNRRVSIKKKKKSATLAM